MALDDDVRQIKQDVADLKRRPLSVNRPSLYIFTIVGMLGAIISCDNLKNYEKTLQIETRDVIGQEAPEKFYEIDGRRVYLEIDGQPVEQYFRK